MNASVGNRVVLTEKQAELRGKASGDTTFLLGVGGSRSGKTFAFCYFADRRAQSAPGSRHLIVRKHKTDVLSAVGLDTMAKVHEHTGSNGVKLHRVPLTYFQYPNGSEVWLGGLDDSNIDKVLGREYATIYINEASEVSFATFETLITRLAQKAKRADGTELPLRFYVDLNPTMEAHWTYQLWIRGQDPVERVRRAGFPDDFDHLFINPMDNAENLPEQTLKNLRALSGGKKKRFFDGRYAADVDGALWSRSVFRRVDRDDVPEFDRIIIAVDPAAKSDIGHDETGITVWGAAGHGTERRAYLLDDASGRRKPSDWGSLVVELYHAHRADAIVCETNNGGEMVKEVIRAAEASKGRMPARVIEVTASKGKAVRAEPAAALYHAGRVYHVGEVDAFSMLEDQMCAFTVGFDRGNEGYSPDRLDSAVWALAELIEEIAVASPPPPPPKAKPKPREF